MPQIQLTQGTVHYRDEGSGPVIVFVHGLLVNGTVWDEVVSRLSGRARCIVPDLPLGSHRVAMNPDADLTPRALADLVAELLERLELQDVTLVGNDTGGAICQLVVAHRPERIGRLALIDCDAFENFPPATFAFAVKALQRMPGLLVLMAGAGRLRLARRLSMKAIPLTLRPVPDELAKSWFAPARNPDVRRDVTKVIRGIVPEVTLGAVEGLRRFERPALVIWGLRDRFFSVRDGERLAETLPNARLERVDDARTFVQLDAPDRVAELIAELASTPALAA